MSASDALPYRFEMGTPSRHCPPENGEALTSVDQLGVITQDGEPEPQIRVDQSVERIS